MNIYKGVADFIMSLAPLASIMVIILWEEQLRGAQLDVSETFAIVSIIGNMAKPLKEFVDILDEYYLYKQAIGKPHFIFRTILTTFRQSE